MARHLSRLSTNAVQKRACANVTSRGTQQSMTSTFEPDADWLAYVASPRKPQYELPPGSVDAHCHVFGPGDVFPYAPERKYTPVDAPKEKLFALHDFLGFDRSVIVQATCHGADNRALVDALRAAGDSTAGHRPAAWPPSARASRAANSPTCTRPASAASASTSSGGSPTPSPMTTTVASSTSSPSSAGTSSSTSRHPTWKSAGTCSLTCRRPSSSTTWAVPTSPSRSTTQDSRCSSGSCAPTRTSGPS